MQCRQYFEGLTVMPQRRIQAMLGVGQIHFFSEETEA